MRVANLNMTDPDQQCPENLRLSYTSPIRVCGRRTNGGCDSVILTTYGVQYQQVCGRVRGYQFGSPDGFNVPCRATCTIDDSYVDGVSITHGSPRMHIWTYAAGYTEESPSHGLTSTCPCTGHGRSPPNFVGSDYYCESGLDHPRVPFTFYPNDVLWDGQGCDGLERTCCDLSNFPWFCKELPQSTTDELEVRICGNSRLSDEDIPINLVQLYIQ